MTAPLVAKAPCDVDLIASEIARVARLARAMPPSWDGAKVAHGFTGTQGENLGRVLPGRGVALASDLKALGITRPIPHVFEKTLAMKAIDAFRGRERMAIAAAAVILNAKLGVLGLGEALTSLPILAGAITNYDGIINARANGKGQDITTYCASATSVATAWHSLLRNAPRFPAGALAPTAIPGGSVLNRASAGALSAGLSNPTGSDKKYILTVGFSHTNSINMLMLVDVLAGASGISANVNTTQTVGTPSLARYADGSGNLVTLEVTTALGASASDVNMTYTNQGGTTGITNNNSSVITSQIVGRLAGGIASTASPYMNLLAGDYGVRVIEAIRFTTAMGAGVLNAYIYRPLHFLPGVGSNVYVERDSTVQIDGLTELVKGSDDEIGFLGFFVLPNGTSTGNATAFLRTVEG
ncbi:hypothetical protein [Gemmatimonas sp.]